MRKVVVADHSGNINNFTITVDATEIRKTFNALRADLQQAAKATTTKMKKQNTPIICSYPITHRPKKKEESTTTAEPQTIRKWITSEPQLDKLKERLLGGHLKKLQCESAGESTAYVTMTPIRKGKDKGKFSLHGEADCNEGNHLSNFLC